MCNLQQLSSVGEQNHPLLNQQLHREEEEPLGIIAARLIQIGDQVTEGYNLSAINEFALCTLWTVFTTKLKNLAQKFVNLAIQVSSEFGTGIP